MTLDLTIEDIKKMHTRQLLSEYRQYRFLTLSHNDHLYGTEDEYYKELAELEEIRFNIKKELDTREHVPNKIETKKIRQLAAKKNKGGRRSHKK